MIRYSPLLDIAEFRIGRFDHPGEHPHRDPAQEVATEYSVNRVERKPELAIRPATDAVWPGLSVAIGCRRLRSS